MKELKHSGKIGTVLEFLKSGKEVTQDLAGSLWRDYNLRNSIHLLRSEGWPIDDRRGQSSDGFSFKFYWLDMDQSRWPKAAA